MISILIIIPTLNSYKSLPSLVQSLQAQTLQQWRVLFIDGPSEQNHRDWLKRLCQEDPRFQWQVQSDINSGIYGAMNQGFANADPDSDWILFWGSDDMAASTSCLEQVAFKLEEFYEGRNSPDLYICTGKYFSSDMKNKTNDPLVYTRLSRFIWRNSFEKSLFCGSSPPHQATLIGPNAREKLNEYDTTFRLAADLDYFLRISRFQDLKVIVDNIEIVLMGDSGVSAKQNNRRLSEVIRAYRTRFRGRWWIPFSLRYLQRFQSCLYI